MEVVINLQERGQIEAVVLLKVIWNWRKNDYNIPAPFILQFCLLLSIFWKIALHIQYTMKSKILWIAKSQVQPIRMQWPLYVYILASIGTYVGPKLGLNYRFLPSPWAFKWVKVLYIIFSISPKYVNPLWKKFGNVFNGCFILCLFKWT